MLVKTIRIPNGDVFSKYFIFKCDRCGETIGESDPHIPEEQKHYCWECSFILGKITEVEFLKCLGVSVSNSHASVIDGEILIWIGSKPPWEQTNKDIRSSGKYKEWRTLVFERDKYTCQHCGQVRGELNAHHIKPFAKYENLRFEVSNGLTLCVPCHKDVHRK